MDGSLFNKALLPMAPSNSADSPRFHFRLWHIFYGMAVLACSLTLFGLAGVLVAIVLLAGIVVSIYGIPRSLRNRPKVLASLIGISLLGLFIWAFDVEQNSYPRRPVCLANLRQIQLAILCYHGSKERFPPPFLVDNTGKRSHSWRVMLLPFIDQQQLYSRYRFDEPWDGPNNRKLIPEMPEVYCCPSNRLHDGFVPGHTTYMAISGATTAWSGKRGLYPNKDDPAISLVEVPGKAIPWTCPDDPTLDEFLVQSQQPAFPWQAGHRRYDYFFTERTGLCAVAAQDGSVAVVSAYATPAEWRDLLERPLGGWNDNLPARSASRICWNIAIPFGILMMLIISPCYRIWRQKSIAHNQTQQQT